MSKNKARDIERKVKAIEKNVTEAWEKYQNPNIFGGGPVIDPQGKIVSLNIKAYGHVAAFFEQESVQRELREAVRKNNFEFAGYDQENVDNKKKVASSSQANLCAYFIPASVLLVHLNQIYQ